MMGMPMVFANHPAEQRSVAGVNLRQPVTGVLALVCHSAARAVLQAGAGRAWHSSLGNKLAVGLPEECRLLQSLEEQASKDTRLHSPACASNDEVGTHDRCCTAVSLACFTFPAYSEHALRLRGQHQHV